MHKSILIRAAVVSLLMASLFEVGTTIIFGGGVEYNPPVNWEYLDSMPREERNTWLREHSTAYDGLESLKKQLSNPDLAIEFLKSFLAVFMLLYTTSILAFYWHWQASRPNPPLNRTRQKRRAG